jgi:hypothetical protein
MSSLCLIFLTFVPTFVSLTLQGFLPSVLLLYIYFHLFKILTLCRSSVWWKSSLRLFGMWHCTRSLFVSRARQTRSVRWLWKSNDTGWPLTVFAPLSVVRLGVYKKRLNNFHWTDLTYTVWAQQCTQPVSFRTCCTLSLKWLHLQTAKRLVSQPC